MTTTAASVPTTAPPSPRHWPTPIRALLRGIFLTRAAGFACPSLPYRLGDPGPGMGAADKILAAFRAGWLARRPVCGWPA
ncbi:hypothetical protein ACFYWN_40915 [Streptomyces sp. NPDC002917]|uniref:hypothetical protein n=1 Tax=Streptomyces sp. NPDC002917 TaxID=3364671 RepID=UPI0036901119